MNYAYRRYEVSVGHKTLVAQAGAGLVVQEGTGLLEGLRHGLMIQEFRLEVHFGAEAITCRQGEVVKVMEGEGGGYQGRAS